MVMKIFIFKTLILLLIIGKANAQENNQSFLVMGMPQYLVIEGLRIDMELKTKKPNQWITISPMVFLKNNEKNLKTRNESVETISGGGLGISFKQFLLNKQGPCGAYFAYGPLYQYYKIGNTGNYWVEKNKEYFEENGRYSAQIHKFGGNCIIGSQFKFLENLYGDIFIGFGIRYSLLIYEGKIGSNYNSNWMDKGFSGILLVSGIRIGVGL